MTEFRSTRIGNLVMSDIRKMTKSCIAQGGINMGQGVCDMPTPEPVRDGAIQAIINRESRYSYAEGVTHLREQIAKKLERDNNITADPNSEIVVGIGATGAFINTVTGLLNPGDGIVLFEPYYGYHLNCAKVSGLIPQYVTLKAPDFEVRAEDIEVAITSNTRAIVICTPSNPCGKMFSAAELELVGQIAEKHNLLIISDEIYEYIGYDGREHISPAFIPSIRDRCVTIMGLSKTFSITGWRLGYAVAKPEFAETLTLVNDLFYICAPTPLQHGAAAGFDLPESFFDSLQTTYQKKRDLFCGALKQAGMEPIIPQGAYYVLARVHEFGFESSKHAVTTLLEKCKVAAVPGTAFYQNTEGEKFIRFCFAIEDHLLEQAAEQIQTFRNFAPTKNMAS